MRKTLLPTTSAIALSFLIAAAGCSHETAASPTAARVEPDSQAESPDPNAAAEVFSPAVDTTGSPASQPAAGTGNEPIADDRAGAVETGGVTRTSAAIAADAATAEKLATEGTSEPAAASTAPASNPATSKAATRPKADRAPRRPGEAEKITFDDLFLNMPADVVYRPFMLSERAKELDGERVSLTGYMHGAAAASRGVKEFVLLRNTECKFGPGGQADHLAQVYLREGNTTEFTPDSLKVEGTLAIEPYQGPDGNTWSIYRLEDAVLK